MTVAALPENVLHGGWIKSWVREKRVIKNFKLKAINWVIKSVTKAQGGAQHTKEEKTQNALFNFKLQCKLSMRKAQCKHEMSNFLFGHNCADYYNNYYNYTD